MKISDIGEFLLIKRLLEILDEDPREILGYDDVSAVRVQERFLVVKTDMFVESADRWPGMPFSSIGWKSIAMNLSDFAAKGVKPLGGLISLGIPGDMDLTNVEELYRGIRDVCREYEIFIWGGDTSFAKELVVVPLLVGFSDKILRRSGAKPGDILVATGSFGYTPVAYRVFFEGYKVEDENFWREVLNRIFYPRVFLKFGVEIARNNMVNAGIDSSDGLAWSLHELVKASKVRVILEYVPIPPRVHAQLEAWGLDPLISTLYEGGEEYVAIYSVSPENLDDLYYLAKKMNVDLHTIGRVEEGSGVYLRKKDKYIPLEAKGWDHFKHDK